MDSVQRVASRYIAASRGFVLSDWGLEGLATGQPVTLYHGTTRWFRKFDLSKSRTDLVNKFYGRGIFLTPSKRVADNYAEANRNIGFDPSVISDVKRRNAEAGFFLQLLVTKGDAAWEIPGIADFEERTGIDPNTLSDIAGYTLGSKVKPLDTSGPLEMFSGATGAPDWVYDSLDEVGVDSKKYRPKIYTVSVRVKNVLVTAQKAKAKSALSKGYDCLVWHGSNLVAGVPEVAVYDPNKVTIKQVEVV